MAKKQIVVKQYKNNKAYQKDANKMLANGYAVQESRTEQPRSGCGRFIALGGIGALVFKPKPIVIVTYRLVE